MEIKNEELQKALAAVILNSFSEEQRQTILQDALKDYLFRPVKGNYGEQPSPVSQHFQKALDYATRKVADEYVAMPENLTRIQGLMREAFEMVITSEEGKKKMIEKMHRAIYGMFG
jgi:hypothetical protein